MFTKIFHDNFQNYKQYNIKKAQLVIADIPYNLGVNAYASSPQWYNDGDNKKVKAKKRRKHFSMVTDISILQNFFTFAVSC